MLKHLCGLRHFAHCSDGHLMGDIQGTQEHHSRGSSALGGCRRAGKSCQTLCVCVLFRERISTGGFAVVLFLFYGNFVTFNIFFKNYQK